MSDRSGKIKVLFSVTNSICYDQRILKMAGIVQELNCKVFIVGRITGKSSENDIIPFSHHRFRMLFRKGFLFYACYNLRLFFYLLFVKYDLLVANDLDTLLPNYLVSKIRNIPLVYDAHEYFTGVPELTGRKFIAKVWESIERWIFPKLEYVLTVSGPIADLYSDKYGIMPLVIRNVSADYGDLPGFSRDHLGIRSEDFLIILQGSGINIDKGAEELIDAIAVTENTSLIIVGSGDVIAGLKRKIIEMNLDDRVKFFGPVDGKTLSGFTRSADAGMCLEKNTNINYRYSLPNKLFDYIMAGIPVISGDLPETGKVIRETGCGLLITAVTPEKISEAIVQLRDNISLYKELKENARKASSVLNWKKESVLVKDMYRNIISEIKNGKK